MNIRETLDRIAPESEAVDLSDLSTYALGYLDAESKYRKMIADGELVEVVRCKDCKHYTWADNRAFGFPVKWCEWTGFEDVDDNDFCSRGERRQG